MWEKALVAAFGVCAAACIAMGLLGRQADLAASHEDHVRALLRLQLVDAALDGGQFRFPGGRAVMTVNERATDLCVALLAEHDIAVPHLAALAAGHAQRTAIAFARRDLEHVHANARAALAHGWAKPDVEGVWALQRADGGFAPSLDIDDRIDAASSVSATYHALAAVRVLSSGAVHTERFRAALEFLAGARRPSGVWPNARGAPTLQATYHALLAFADAAYAGVAVPENATHPRAVAESVGFVLGSQLLDGGFGPLRPTGAADALGRTGTALATAQALTVLLRLAPQFGVGPGAVPSVVTQRAARFAAACSVDGALLASDYYTVAQQQIEPVQPAHVGSDAPDAYATEAFDVLVRRTGGGSALPRARELQLPWLAAAAAAWFAAIACFTRNSPLVPFSSAAMQPEFHYAMLALAAQFVLTCVGPALLGGYLLVASCTVCALLLLGASVHRVRYDEVAQIALTARLMLLLPVLAVARLGAPALVASLGAPLLLAAAGPAVGAFLGFALPRFAYAEFDDASLQVATNAAWALTTAASCVLLAERPDLAAVLRESALAGRLALVPLGALVDLLGSSVLMHLTAATSRQRSHGD